MKMLLICAGLLILPGCFLDREEKPVVQNNTPMDALKTEVVSSNNSTQNKMEGLITASVSKLGEKVTGIESSISVVHPKIVGLETKIDSLLKIQTDITTSLRDVNTKIQTTANVEAFKDLKASLTANLDAQVKIQADLKAQMSNVLEINRKMETRIETLNATAGRDVLTNYFPKEAAEVMITQAKIFAGIVSTLAGLVATLASIWARNSRRRADLRFQEERAERQELLKLIHK